jgi:hypothetical protein
VNKDVDCRVFEDQLDSLISGELSEEGAHHLRRHALVCPDCTMLLKVQEHMALPSLAELSAAVPQEHLDSMWTRVEDGLASREEEKRREEPRRVRRTWLIPTLAAASVALLFSSGFLFSELRQATSRETALARRIGDLERGLAELDSRAEWAERTARLGERGRRSARAVSFALAGRESITVGDLQGLLGRFPSDMIVLDASHLEDLTGAATPPPPELREILSVLAEAYGELGTPRELRAGDLLEWLAESDLPTDMNLSTSQIIGLLNRTS